MQQSLNKTGFTIVELLIVVVVIAILASITIVSYSGINARAKESSIVSNLNTFSNKYQQLKILNSDTGVPTSEFNSIGTVFPDNFTIFIRQLTLAGKVTSFCADTSADATQPRYFINSTDRTTPTKGICTGASSGQYTLE